MDAPTWTYVVVVPAVVALGALAWVSLQAGSARLGLTERQRRFGALVAATVIGGWLLVDLGLAAAGVFRARTSGIPWIAFGVAGPLIGGIALLRFSPVVSRTASAVPQAWLLGLHTTRVVGATFLVLAAQHRLPWLFASPAGWGDMLIGATAPFVAWAYLADRTWSRPVAIAFNLAGLADFVVAVGTGFLSAPSPVRLFFTQPSTALMSVMPMVLIPVFAVPLYALTHVVSLRGLLHRASRQAVPQWAPPARQQVA